MTKHQSLDPTPQERADEVALAAAHDPVAAGRAADADFQQLQTTLDARGIDCTFTITTPEQYAAAGEVVLECKRRVRRVHEFFQPIKDAINRTRETVLEAERARVARLTDLAQAAERGLMAYRRAQDAARRKAEQEAMRQAEAEAAQRQAEEVAALAAAGDLEAAEELAAEVPAPAMVPPVVVADEPPPVAGLSFAKRYRARIIDLPRFLRWVAQDPAARAHYVAPNMVALNGLARSARESMAIPGVVAEAMEGAVGRVGRQS
jgi:hypothetical protein